MENRVTIQALCGLGLTCKKVAELLKLNVKTVKKWKGRTGTAELPRRKQPRVLTEDVKETIQMLGRDVWGASTRKITKTINSSESFIQQGQTISRSCVLKYLKTTDWGRFSYRPIIKPLLSQKNVSDRLAFCAMIRALHYCGGDDESKQLVGDILFTDESIVELFPKPNAQNTRIRTLEPQHRSPIQVPKHGLKIMVAGGLCANGLTRLHIVEDKSTVTAAYYRGQILPVYLDAVQGRQGDASCSQDRRPLFEDPGRAVFMQDGAPAHTANTTMQFLRERFTTIWGKGIWPGNSPDLNPIENLWPILQDSVFVAPRPRTRAELIERVNQTWSNISLELVHRLAHSFPSRIEACLANNGKHTKY